MSNTQNAQLLLAWVPAKLREALRLLWHSNGDMSCESACNQFMWRYIKGWWFFFLFTFWLWGYQYNTCTVGGDGRVKTHTVHQGRLNGSDIRWHRVVPERSPHVSHSTSTHNVTFSCTGHLTSNDRYVECKPLLTFRAHPKPCSKNFKLWRLEWSLRKKANVPF